MLEAVWMESMVSMMESYMQILSSILICGKLYKYKEASVEHMSVSDGLVEPATNITLGLFIKSVIQWNDAILRRSCLKRCQQEQGGSCDFQICIDVIIGSRVVAVTTKNA